MIDGREELAGRNLLAPHRFLIILRFPRNFLHRPIQEIFSFTAYASKPCGASSRSSE